jgi:hypothetical protein
MLGVLVALLVAGPFGNAASAKAQSLRLTTADYQDRVHAAWAAEIMAVLLAWPHEHNVSSREWISTYPRPYTSAPVDDDWYYEMVALRGFEKYGIHMTVDQLGEQWKENSAGSWGSSEQARLLLGRGMKGSETGSPRYNKLWFTIGPQFSADIYGMIAPGNPNLAGRLARQFGHLNGYAEGTDGAVFMAGMVSLGFRESDPKEIVREAARLIHPSSPYRQCLDLVIGLAEQGKNAEEVFGAVEDRWHMEYPATNNAVANGGIVAASVWFGEGDFLKTVNLAAGAADFTDADCNAANAATVIGAMHGLSGLPAALLEQLHDRIVGSEMGSLKLTPPVDERISELARRTAVIGKQIALAHGAKGTAAGFEVPFEEVQTQPAELFRLADLMQYWNPEWKLERAGFGGAGGGMRGIRGITYLDGDVLATYPRDEVRGLVLSRKVKPGSGEKLHVEVGCDAGRGWQLQVYAAGTLLLDRTIEGGSDKKDRKWESVDLDLQPFAGREVDLRLLQRVLLPGKTAGNAYWRGLRITH